MIFRFFTKYQRPLIKLFLMVIFFAISYVFIENNAYMYQQPIAQITKITDLNSANEVPTHLEYDVYYHQSIEATLLNTEKKGLKVNLESEYTFSKAYNDYYKVGQCIFLKPIGSDLDQRTFVITGLKRDQHILSIFMVFAFAAVFIGGRKGLRSLGSVLVNILILYGLLYFYMNDYNLHLITISAALLFIVTSMAFVTGFNQKTLAASIGTGLGTASAVLIAYIVFSLIHYEGVYFEEMEFMLTSPMDVFYLELIIGTLGGIMDIAVSMASSIEELIETSPQITKKQLARSGMIIGNDTMGTMTNTLIFAYLSGSIPMLLLMVMNNIHIGFVLNVNISLEILRALVSSIGIVISIPITLAVSILLLYKREEAVNR